MSAAVIMILAMNLGLGSVIVWAFYWIINFVKDKILRGMMTSVTIDNKDSVYKWLLTYLTEKGFLAENMNDVIVKVVKKKKEWHEWGPKTKKDKPKVEYFPSPGKHFFLFKGKKMWAF